MSCDKLTFWPRHCQHSSSLPAAINIPVKLHLSTSTYLRTSATMPLALHVENLTTSMTAPAKPQKSKKLKKLKPIKIPLAISGIEPAYQGISKLADSKRKKYIVLGKHILKLTTIPKLKAELIDETKPLNLAFISVAPFQYLIKQKEVKIFTVSMRDIKNELNAILMKNIKYQLNKTAKTPTNSKTVIPKEYHKFLDVFSKEASDTLLPHSKYNHQIRLLKGYKNYGNSSLNKMSELKLQFVKKFLEKHLNKGFIKASSASCFSQIMLIAKFGEDIRFCANHRHLNKFTKKDAYLILLIEEILA